MLQLNRKRIVVALVVVLIIAAIGTVMVSGRLTLKSSQWDVESARLASKSSDADIALSDADIAPPINRGTFNVHAMGSACARTSYYEANEDKCAAYEKLKHIVPDCSGQAEKVPRIYHSVGRLASQTFVQSMVAKANPSFRRNHLDDRAAGRFIRRACGEAAAAAYACLAAPAYRADLFRFCALYAEGGVYLDQDILPLFPLEELYSPCSNATLGHDMPQSLFWPSWGEDDATVRRVMEGRPRKIWSTRRTLHAKQMKILAAAPGSALFKCAMEATIEHIRQRTCSESSLERSGPIMLHQCYTNHSEGAAISYSDSRHAMWPYSGMRRGNKVLAIEIGNPKRHFPWTTKVVDVDNYAQMHVDQTVIRPTCALRPAGSTDKDLASRRATCALWYKYYAVP